MRAKAPGQWQAGRVPQTNPSPAPVRLSLPLAHAHTHACAHTQCAGEHPQRTGGPGGSYTSHHAHHGHLRGRAPALPCAHRPRPCCCASPHRREGAPKPHLGAPGKPAAGPQGFSSPPRDAGGTRKLILGHFCFVEHAETREVFTEQGLKAGAPGNSGSVRTSALPPGGLEQVAWGLSFLASDTEPAVASA